MLKGILKEADEIIHLNEGTFKQQFDLPSGKPIKEVLCSFRGLVRVK